MLQIFLRSLFVVGKKENIMQLLHQTISKLKGFKEWFDTLDLHESQLVLGLSGSVKHLAESCAFEKLDKQLVIVTPTLLQATQTYEELSEWYDDEVVHLFPVEESLAADFSIVSPDVVSQRIRTLDFLSRGQRVSSSYRSLGFKSS